MDTENKHTFAFFQGITDDASPEKNLMTMKEQMSKASAVGAEMILFPELFLSGYCVPAEQMKKVAEERNGPSFQELSKAAKEANIAVLYGYPEVDQSSGSEIFYNSAQLINKDGSSLANYRKSHLWIDDMGYEKVFKPGKAFENIVDCCGIKIGILICFDVEFPECARTLALKGVQLIAVPTALVYTKFKSIPRILVPSRARENGVHIAYVNHAGAFNGHSVCCDVNGDIMVQAGAEEQLELFTVNPLSKPACNFISMRRPDVYCK